MSDKLRLLPQYCVAALSPLLTYDFCMLRCSKTPRLGLEQDSCFSWHVIVGMK